MIFLYDTSGLEIRFYLNTALCITRNGDAERDKSRPYAGAMPLIVLFSRREIAVVNDCGNVRD